EESYCGAVRRKRSSGISPCGLYRRVGNVPGAPFHRMGRESDAERVGSSCQRVSRARVVSAQYLSGVAGRAWFGRSGVLCLADEGTLAVGSWFSECFGGISRQTFLPPLATFACGLLGQRVAGGNELS